MVVPLPFAVGFTMLQRRFEYADILRQSTADVLAKFAAGDTPLIAVWYVLTLAALAFIALSVLVHRVLAERGAPVLLWLPRPSASSRVSPRPSGSLRWPFPGPDLAQSYLAPSATEVQRVAAGMAFEGLPPPRGMAVGEHLGYMSTSVRTILVAVVILRTGILPRRIGAIGAVLGVAIAAGPAEQAGWEVGGTINMFSYLVRALWLIAFGALLLVVRARPALGGSAPRLAAAAVA